MSEISRTASPRRRDAALLAALFAARPGRISRPALARAGAIAEAEVESALAPYVEAGYPIAFHPQGGISLAETPDIWCAEEILGRAGSDWDPLLLAETTSTNDVARQQGRKGARSGFVVAAARQTKGRGRLGRAWESPDHGGLYVSVLLRPDWAADQAGRLTILSSVAAADAVERLCGARPRIKWPNDLQLDGRKLAGLLIEAEPRGRRLDFAVIGIGINVLQEAEDFSPGVVRGLATSLRIATGRIYRRADLLVELLLALERRLAEPFEDTRAAWASSSVTPGQQVVLTTARGQKAGQALGLDEAGALLLRNDAGEIEAITAGDMRAILTEE